MGGESLDSSPVFDAAIRRTARVCAESHPYAPPPRTVTSTCPETPRTQQHIILPMPRLPTLTSATTGLHTIQMDIQMYDCTASGVLMFQGCK